MINAAELISLKIIIKKIYQIDKKKMLTTYDLMQIKLKI